MKLVVDTRMFWINLMRFAYRRCASIETNEPDGIPGRRCAESPCNGYEPRGKRFGDWVDCDSDGHYLCKECAHLKKPHPVTERSRKC